jgi:hypothetical protein
MPGRDPRRPPLSERLRLEPDDCWDPVPMQLLQKCARCRVCSCLTAMSDRALQPVLVATIE